MDDTPCHAIPNLTTHACPMFEKIAMVDQKTALLMSASGNTMLADLPPNSRETFFRLEVAAAAMILRPVAVEPVKATYLHLALEA